MLDADSESLVVPTCATKPIDALKADLDEWLHHYNYERTHQGKMCCGRTPVETMIDGKEIWREKLLN
jgi:hypothetical protein